MSNHTPERTASHEALAHFISEALVAAGSSEEQALSVARALSGASLRGVDSHGVRLLPHYLSGLEGGRIARQPKVSVQQRLQNTIVVDADNGFGHHASYRAIEAACDAAGRSGIAAVSVINSSHFGAAGCYVLDAAERGLAAFAFCNSDSFVLPHDGTAPFHGTNPIAFAAPVSGEQPFLVDMATSIVPWNRIQDYRSKGLSVPHDVAVDALGRVTRNPADVAALLPVGGQSFGYKGAALASMIEVLSAVMTGMAHCSRLIPMVGDDMSTPRRLGHFFIVLNPEAFVSRAVYDRGMATYLADIRSAAAQAGKSVMAPGDREWWCADTRRRDGIPMNASLVEHYGRIAVEHGVPPLAYQQ